MKSVRDFIASDMWSHILMSGPDVRGLINGTKYPTLPEQEEYCQGIFATYPHMMLGNFNRWLWDDGSPKDYNAFMQSSVQALQSKVFPVLKQAFQPEVSRQERGEMLIPLLTDVIPKHVLTGYYDYMFASRPDYKDISDFWPKIEPVLHLTARMIRTAYDPAVEMPTAEQEEVFLFVGTRYAYLLLKRWYDWQFGEDKMEMPPPPPHD